MAKAGYYRLEAKIVKRSAGESVVAKAAYMTRETIEDQRLGRMVDYRRHGNKALFTGFYAATTAPEWAQERASFWNAVEAYEARKDAQLGREFIGGFPHQMSIEHARYAIQDFVRENFSRKGMAADVAIHPAHDHGDERNIHVHILTPLRRLDRDGEWSAKAQQFIQDPDSGKMIRADKAELQHLREQFAHHLNRQLERFGYDIRVDHRNYAARGIEREPGVHLGKRDAAKERAGERTQRGDINRDIAARNEARATLREEIATLENTPRHRPRTPAAPARQETQETRSGKEIAQDVGYVAGQAAGVAGKLLGGGVRVLEGVFGALSDFFTGTPQHPVDARQEAPRQTPPLEAPAILNERSKEVTLEGAASPSDTAEHAHAGEPLPMPRELQEAIRRRIEEMEARRRERDHGRER